MLLEMIVSKDLGLDKETAKKREKKTIFWRYFFLFKY